MQNGPSECLRDLDLSIAGQSVLSAGQRSGRTPETYSRAQATAPRRRPILMRAVHPRGDRGGRHQERLASLQRQHRAALTSSIAMAFRWAGRMDVDWAEFAPYGRSGYASVHVARRFPGEPGQVRLQSDGHSDSWCPATSIVNATASTNGMQLADLTDRGQLIGRGARRAILANHGKSRGTGWGLFACRPG